MANTDIGTREGNYHVEIDGIPPFRATKVSGGAEKHTAVELQEGNNLYAQPLPGNIKPDDLVITIASGKNQTAINAIARKVAGYFDRSNSAPFNARYIVYGSDGRTPTETWEARNCVPVGFGPDDRTAEGTGAATVTLTLKPEKVRKV